MDRTWSLLLLTYASGIVLVTWVKFRDRPGLRKLLPLGKLLAVSPLACGFAFSALLAAFGALLSDVLFTAMLALMVFDVALDVAMAQFRRVEASYYAEAFGFDPEAERKRSGVLSFRYEAWFPLAADPDLDRAGVELGARVEVTGGDVANKLVFRKRNADAEGVVRCVHSVLKTVDAAEAANLAAEVAAGRTGDLGGESRPMVVGLSPEEHFVALRSYAAAIAEFGVENLLKLDEPDSPGSGNASGSDGDLPFGFNAAMRGQVVRALAKVAPTTTRKIVVEHVAALCRTGGRDWVEKRVDHLFLVYALKKTLFADPEAFDALDAGVTASELRWMKAKADRARLRVVAWVSSALGGAFLAASLATKWSPWTLGFGVLFGGAAGLALAFRYLLGRSRRSLVLPQGTSSTTATRPSNASKSARRKTPAPS
ncbi:MAG: hypothetical protein Kow0069_00460 [Promethearchaeota archaeon]